MSSNDSFNLHTTLIEINKAIYAVVCHMLFDAAIHGLFMALLLCLIGFVFYTRKQRFAKPFLNVGKRLGLACLVLITPGIIALLSSGQLPAAGVFNVNSLGFIVFWSLVCLHLLAEEMNYQWY